MDSERAVRPELTSAGTGIEVGDDANDDEPNRFTYPIAATGTQTASLVITRKPGRHDEYDLTILDGNLGGFVRREFQKNTLKDTDTGIFSGSPSLN